MHSTLGVWSPNGTPGLPCPGLRGERLTIHGVRHLLRRLRATAAETCSSLRNRRITRLACAVGISVGQPGAATSQSPRPVHRACSSSPHEAAVVSQQWQPTPTHETCPRSTVIDVFLPCCWYGVYEPTHLPSIWHLELSSEASIVGVWHRPLFAAGDWFQPCSHAYRAAACASASALNPKPWAAAGAVPATASQPPGTPQPNRLPGCFIRDM